MRTASPRAAASSPSSRRSSRAHAGCRSRPRRSCRWRRSRPCSRRAGGPGILTISRVSLTEEHLALAGAPLDAPVGGTDEGREFTRVILDDELELDVDLARQDVVDAARRLVENHPEVGALVLECTNMCPYSADVAEAVGLPVYDFVSFVTWFQSGLKPRRF